MGRYVSGSELILKEGVTTSNGNAGGTTLIDASLIGRPNYPTGLQVRLLSGTYQYITRTVESFNTTTGTITIPTANPFPGQIVAGTGYVIMGVTASSAESLAALGILSPADGTTTNAGAGGLTVIDTARTEGLDYWKSQTLMITSGACDGQVREITGYNNATQTFTVSPAFFANILAGVTYRVLSQLPADIDITALQADVGDASAAAMGSLYGILGNPSASLATTILDGIDARANNPTLNALLGVTDAGGRSINGNIGDFQAQTNLQTLLASLGIPDVAAKPLYTCLITDRLDNATYGLSAIETLVDDLETRLTAARAGYLDNIAATAAGRAQIATATIDLNQAAATYDLFTGTTQNVLVEKLVIRMPDLAAGGALTSISIQTDDSTPQVFISAALGAVANLTAQAQLSSDAPVIVTTGKKIRLTIAGGAHGVAYSCTVTVMYRSVVAGGYLA